MWPRSRNLAKCGRTMDMRPHCQMNFKCRSTISSLSTSFGEEGKSPVRKLCACCVKTYSAPLHRHIVHLDAVEQHLRSKVKDMYPKHRGMALYHLASREERNLFNQSTLLLVKIYNLGLAALHFPTQKWVTEGL